MNTIQTSAISDDGLFRVTTTSTHDSDRTRVEMKIETMPRVFILPQPTPTMICMATDSGDDSQIRKKFVKADLSAPCNHSWHWYCYSKTRQLAGYVCSECCKQDWR